MSEVEEAPEEILDLPKAERESINRMADKFRDALKMTKPATQAESQPTKAAKPAETAPPTSAAQPAEPPPVKGDPVLPGEVKGKARESFDRLEGMMKKYRADSETTKAEFEKFKAGGNLSELETLRKQLTERDKVLAGIAVEKHPGFQKLFGDRLQTAMTDAKEALGTEDATAIESVFSLPAGAQRDSQIELLAEGLTDFKKIALHDAYKNLKGIERDKALELSRAPDTLKAIREHNERNAKQAELQNIRQKAALVQHITAQIEPDLTGADPELVKSIVADAKRFVDGGDGELYVRTVADAARWRRHESTLQQQAELIEKYQAQIEEIHAANPSLQSSGGNRLVKSGELEPIGDKYRKALIKQGRIN